MKEFPQNEDLMPTSQQITSRKQYIKRIVLKELLTIRDWDLWLRKYEYDKYTKEHDLIILHSFLDEDNFLLVYSTKSLLKNIINQSQSEQTYFALDTTQNHQLRL